MKDTAYENARLLQQARTRLEQTRSLQEITASITAETDLAPIARTVVERTRAVFGADRIALYLLDRQTRRVTCAASHGLSAEYLSALGAYYQRTGDWPALGNRDPKYVADAQNDPLVKPLWTAIRAEGFRSALILPLFRLGQPVGGLVLYHDHFRAYAPDEVALAHAFAVQAAMALEGARLQTNLLGAYEATRAHLRQAEVLQRFSTLVAATCDVGAIVESAADAFQLAFGADRLLICRQDQVTGQLRPALVRGLSARYVETVIEQYSGSLGRQALLAERPLAIEDIVRERDRLPESLRAVMLEEGFRSILIVPLAYAKPATGTVAICHDRPRRYDETELYLARIFGDQVAVAVRDAELYQRAQAERERLAAIIDQMAEGVTVMDADRRRRPVTSATARSRPTKLVTGLGRLWLGPVAGDCRAGWVPAGCPVAPRPGTRPARTSR